MSVHHMNAWQLGEKKTASDPLELEKVLRHHVGARNQTLALCLNCS